MALVDRVQSPRGYLRHFAAAQAGKTNACSQCYCDAVKPALYVVSVAYIELEFDGLSREVGAHGQKRGG